MQSPIGARAIEYDAARGRAPPTTEVARDRSPAAASLAAPKQPYPGALQT
jgi:hypothetical protein